VMQGLNSFRDKMLELATTPVQSDNDDSQQP